MKTKIKIIVLLLISAIISGCNKSIINKNNTLVKKEPITNTKSLPTQGIKIVMLGDSETRRINHYWGVDTNWNTLMGFDTILNHGYDAYTSGDILDWPIYDAMNQNPDLICLMIGINDAHQSIPESVTISNISIMIDSIQNRDIDLVIQSVLPTTSYYYGGILSARAMSLNVAIYQLCQTKGVPFLDVRPGMVTISSSRANTYLRNDKSIDGVHINYEGYEIWRDHLTTWLINNNYIN